MTPDFILQISQTFFAVGSVILILLQPPVDESGTARNLFSPQGVKRGWEKMMFSLTIFFVVAFTFVSAIRIILT